MKEIWKFPLVLEDKLKAICSVEMPTGAEILTLQVQKGVPCLWALVTPDANRVWRKFLIVGTGRALIDASVHGYIGTFQDHPYVWHVFEEAR